jgi:hypothetical protein
MTIHALATGVLWKSPEQRTAKSGNPFTTATVRVKDGDATQWVCWPSRKPRKPN